MKEGFSVADFEMVIAEKYIEWVAESNNPVKTKAWFRPRTLFSKNKFPKYVEMAKANAQQQKSVNSNLGHRQRKDNPSASFTSGSFSKGKYTTKTITPESLKKMLNKK